MLTDIVRSTRTAAAHLTTAQRHLAYAARCEAAAARAKARLEAHRASNQHAMGDKAARMMRGYLHEANEARRLGEAALRRHAKLRATLGD